MRKSLSLMVGLAILGGLARAQTSYVSPGAYNNVVGSGNYFPFGSSTYTHWRYQQVHADIPATFSVITGLAWRRSNSPTPYAACDYRLRLTMSTARVTPANTSWDFYKNHGPDLTTVISGAAGPTAYLQVKWPPTTAPRAQPGPFTYYLPFVRPFLFSKNPVCWDIQISGRSRANSNYYFDSARSDPNVSRVYWNGKPDQLGSRSVGPATCIASDQTQACRCQLTAGDLINNNWQIKLAATALKRNSSAIYTLGSSQASWGTIPLPFLIPGSTTCQLTSNIIFLGMALPTDSMGKAVAPTLIVPGGPWFLGTTIFNQWIGADPKAPLGVIVTPSLAIDWPKEIFPPTRAAGGFANSGLITRFFGR